MGDNSKSEQWKVGPWRCEGPDMFGDWNILHDGDALAVAAVISNMRPEEEVAANAHLAASAPDLRKALTSAATLLQFLSTEITDDILRIRASAVLSDAHAALDRAENRTIKPEVSR